MINNQLENINEEKKAENIAAQLGMTKDELQETNYELGSEESRLNYNHFWKKIVGKV